MQQPNDGRYEFILECLIGLSCLVLFSILWSNKGVISSAVNNITGGNTKQTTADTGKPVTGKEKAILPLPKMKPPGRKSSYGWRINPVTGKRQFHNGHDIGAAQGTPILSILPGKVTAAGYIGACRLGIETRIHKQVLTTSGCANCDDWQSLKWYKKCH